MNNLSSYCGLVDAKIRASDKDLPVKLCINEKIPNISPPRNQNSNEGSVQNGVSSWLCNNFRSVPLGTFPGFVCFTFTFERRVGRKSMDKSTGI